MTIALPEDLLRLTHLFSQGLVLNETEKHGNKEKLDSMGEFDFNQDQSLIEFSHQPPTVRFFNNDF